MLSQERVFELMKEAGLDEKKYNSLMEKETAMLSDDELDEVAGGFGRKSRDSYTEAEYADAGIKWNHHAFWFDTYEIGGCKMDRTYAAKAMKMYESNGRQPLTVGQIASLVDEFAAKTKNLDN